MPDAYGNVVKVPGTSGTSEVKPAEILYSYAKFTQKGVTLAGGQGLLAGGTVLGRVTATKKYVAYTDGATGGAGSDTARGVLRQPVDTSKGDVPGNIVISGILKRSKLVGLTAAAVTDLDAREDTVNDILSF
jgi:Bacteriophage lambda head decoration protein D